MIHLRVVPMINFRKPKKRCVIQRNEVIMINGVKVALQLVTNSGLV